MTWGFNGTNMSIIQQFCISYLWFSIRKSNDILVPMKMLEIKYIFLLDLLHNYNRSDEASFCLQISKDMNVERCRSWEGMEHIINDLVIYNMTLVKTIVNTSVKVFSIVFWHRGEETKHRHVFYTFKGSRQQMCGLKYGSILSFRLLCQQYVLVCGNSISFWFSNSNI